jgi:hypothetical protein
VAGKKKGKKAFKRQTAYYRLIINKQRLINKNRV